MATFVPGLLSTIHLKSLQIHDIWNSTWNNDTSVRLNIHVQVFYDRDILWTPSFTTYCLVPQELLYEASVTPFKCLNTEKSEHTKVGLSLVIWMQTYQSGHQEKWRTWRLLPWIHSCVCTAEGNFTDQGRLWVKTEVQHHLLLWNSFH